MARAFPQSMQRYPLSVILGTDSGVRLSRELALHGGQLAASELVHRTGLSKASVARGLVALEKSGAFRAVGTDRSRLYSLRGDHAIALAIRNLFEAETVCFRDMLDGIRTAAQSVGPELLALWLYGSVARGEDREDSDLDLALIVDTGGADAVRPDRRQAFADTVRDNMAAFSGKTGFRPSVVVLDTDDVARLSASRDPWWLGMLNDAQALVGERPDAMAARLARHVGRTSNAADQAGADP